MFRAIARPRALFKHAAYGAHQVNTQAWSSKVILQEADQNVVTLKQEVQMAQERLNVAMQDRSAAEEELQIAEAQLHQLENINLPAEQLSLQKLYEELAEMREQLSRLTSERKVYEALNDQIQRGSR